MISEVISKFNQTDSILQIFEYKLNNNYYKPGTDKIIELIINNLQKYNPQVLYSTMNGNVCRGLNRERNAGVPIQLSGIIDKLYNSNQNWDLVDYLVMAGLRLLIEKPYLKHINNRAELERSLYITLGRCIVTFPSMLREIDLYEKMLIIDPTLQIERDESSDINDHADLKIYYNNRVYLLWSYVMTNSNIRKTYEKLIGNKGVIPNGNHYLIPFNFNNCDNIYNWQLHKITEVENILNRIKNNEVDIDYETFLNSNKKENQCKNNLIILK